MDDIIYLYMDDVISVYMDDVYIYKWMASYIWMTLYNKFVVGVPPPKINMLG